MTLTTEEYAVEKFFSKNYKLLKKGLHFHESCGSIINGSLVKRLRRRPLTAETRVRFPYGLCRDFLDGSPFFVYRKEDVYIW